MSFSERKPDCLNRSLCHPDFSIRYSLTSVQEKTPNGLWTVVATKTFPFGIVWFFFLWLSRSFQMCFILTSLRVGTQKKTRLCFCWIFFCYFRYAVLLNYMYISDTQLMLIYKRRECYSMKVGVFYVENDENIPLFR